jgi:transposase
VNFKRAWSYQLWKRYLWKGLGAVSEYPFKGTRPRLTAEQAEQFKDSLATDAITRLQDAVNRLTNEYGITYTIGGMCYVMKRLGIKKKTGRPSHVHKDEGAVQTFKKKHQSS